MHHRLRKAGRRLARLDAQSRHRLRIKAKRLRYAAEFFAGAFGRRERRKRFLSALRKLQDRLGRLHDASAAPELAFRLVRRRSAAAGYAAGLIAARQRASARKTERAALESFDAFERARPFWT
jgi:CHAD domain-containing protein